MKKSIGLFSAIAFLVIAMAIAFYVKQEQDGPYGQRTLLTTFGNITTGTITGGLYNGQTISSAANFTGTLKTAGNVGIGTTSVANALTVSSSLATPWTLSLFGNTNGSDGYMRLYKMQDAAGGVLTFDGTVSMSSPSGAGTTMVTAMTQDYPAATRGAAAIEVANGNMSFDFVKAQGAMTRAMFISNDGIIGIGTTTPAVKLHVVTSAGATLSAVGSSNSGANASKLCLWNGASFSKITFASNSATVSVATSTTCN